MASDYSAHFDTIARGIDRIESKVDDARERTHAHVRWLLALSGAFVFTVGGLVGSLLKGTP